MRNRQFAASLLLCASMIVAAASATAQLSITTPGVPLATQTFDNPPTTMPTTGAAVTFVQNSTAGPAWYALRTGTGTTITPSTGTSPTGALYSFGADSAADRALGSIGSSNAAAGNFAWGVVVQNNTTSVIGEMRVQYDLETWRTQAASNRIDFAYLIGSGLNETNLVPSTMTPAGYVDVDALDGFSVVGSAGAAVDGNTVKNSYDVTFGGFSLAPGQQMLLRWWDPDHSGNDAGVGIDNVILTPNVATSPILVTDFTGFSDDFGSVMVGSASTPSQTFTVAGDFLTGPVTLQVSGVGFELSTNNSTWFTVLNLPVSGGNVTGEPVTIYLRFNPATNDFLTDILDISSPSATSVTRNLSGAAYTTTGPYAGLVVSEVVSQPTVDEYIEIYNSTASPMDISGVIVTDEDTSNTEGAASFPTGTVLAPGEVIMVAANNSAAEPSWLDILPANTRVYVEPARVAASASWTTINGITLTALDDVPSVANEIAISSGDGIGLFAPGTVFGVSSGPTPLINTIDGMNFNNTDAGGRTPINNGGSRETQASRVGNNQPPVGQSYARIDTLVNTDSSLRYQLQPQTPGVFGAPSDDPNAAAPGSANFVSVFSGTVDVNIPISNTGATNALNVTAATITGPNAAKFTIIGSLPTGIAPSSSGNITVRYTPGVLGSDTATLNVTSNDASSDVVSTTLNGYGINTAFDYANPVSIQLVVSESDIMAHTGQSAASVDLRAIGIDSLGRLYTYTASKSSGTDADTVNPALVRIDVSGPTPVFTTIAPRSELAAACNIGDATSLAFNGINVVGTGSTIYFSQFGGVDDVVRLVPGSPNTFTNMFEGDGIAFSVFDNAQSRLAVCRINDFGGPFGDSNFFSLDLTNLTGPWTEDIIATEAEIVAAGVPVGAGENGVVFASHMSDNSWLLWDEYFREGSDRILRLVEGNPPTITTAVEFDQVGPDPTGEGFEMMLRDQFDTLFCWNEFPDSGASPASEGIFIFPAPINPATRIILNDDTINTALSLTGNRDIAAGGMALRQVSPTQQVLYVADEIIDGIYAITFQAPPSGLEGDADGDGTLNAGDVTAIYNHLAGIQLLTGSNLTNAATIAPPDATLDTADVNALIQYLVNGTPLP